MAQKVNQNFDYDLIGIGGSPASAVAALRAEWEHSIDEVQS